MIAHIEQALQRMTCKALGLEPTDKESNTAVRIAYQGAGAPFPHVLSTDVAFLFADLVDAPITQQRDVEYTGEAAGLTQRRTSYLAVVQARWTLYGPHAAERALLIRDGLFRPDLHMLNMEANLALITNPSVPRRFPELYKGHWLERWDFTAQFNYLVVRETGIPYLEPGTIIIKKG